MEDCISGGIPVDQGSHSTEDCTSGGVSVAQGSHRMEDCISGGNFEWCQRNFCSFRDNFLGICLGLIGLDQPLVLQRESGLGVVEIGKLGSEGFS